MTEQPDNLILVYLRRIDEKVDRLSEDARDLKARMSGVESALGHLQTQVASVNARIDRVETRLERVERRLDLADA